jgi:formylglycine-generating enzyme required for sulfatase activity
VWFACSAFSGESEPKASEVDGATTDASSADSAERPTDATMPVDADAGLEAACSSIYGAAVGISTATTSYCIDAKEVTTAQYQAFLDKVEVDAGWMSTQPPACAWNTDLTPTCVTLDVDAPIVCIDWCDARAYCAWAGKRLCGRIGGGGLILDAKRTNPSVDQWYRACSSNGSRRYPYGDAYEPQVCNDDAGASVHPASLTGCVGGFPGLYDMSGNVNEWQDACDDAGADAALDLCSFRGGSFLNHSTAACDDTSGNIVRRGTYGDLGFRCCSDP